ncbi:MAG: PVC-type heme-binding CxxCH protein, partial [Pirellulales bacterium]
MRISLAGLMSVVLLLVGAVPVSAQRGLKNIPEPNPDEELATFILPEGFEANLYASDPLLRKPIHMNFDAEGRLWVASSEIYPQIEPGQPANDKILVLEDTNNDGRADKTTTFADGLLIPTGVLPGDGGVYVANSTELLHLTDTDGDGAADRRRIVLSGFGTEDTHHILHTLRFGPDGMIYMNQSIYIHSHIETPHGVRRMDGGGVWHFRPETLELETFTLGLVNSWGHVFDRFGQSFQTDGAGGDGINYVFPGWVGVTSPGAKRVMRGLNPGSPKHCGLERISGRHFPEDWQGDLIANDFRAHRVCRFKLSDDNSGFSSQQQPEVIKSSHVAFRPIDAKMGPDGALYIADWYNPIIQHGEVDFRDPRRDHVHGRIWRVTAKGRPLVEKPRIVGVEIAELLAMLELPEQFTRDHAKLELKSRGKQAVLPELEKWIPALDLTTDEGRRAALEGLWTYQSLNVVEQRLLATLMQADDFRIRAAATRVLYHWNDSVPQAMSLLSEAVADEHPRVRLEAVHALRNVSDPRACQVAARVLNMPMDANLDYALWVTCRETKDRWLTALQAGEIDFGGNVAHLNFALKAAETKDVVPLLVDRYRKGEVPAEQRTAVLATIASLGQPTHLQVVFEAALADDLAPSDRLQLLTALTGSPHRPSGNLADVDKLLDDQDPAVAAAALAAVGKWKLESLRPQVEKLAAESTSEVRRPAIEAVAALGGPRSIETLKQILADSDAHDLRTAAIAGMAQIDPAVAAVQAAAALAVAKSEHEPGAIIEAFLGQKDGPQLLAKEIAGKQLNTDVAKLAIRTVESFGKPLPELVAALRTAGGVAEGQTWTADQRQQILDSLAGGDPRRGEQIYRLAELSCLKCHAIGGAGGQVGPDLVSIGASAQPDYLLESLIDPGAKIKENYHSLVVFDKQGRVFTGVKVRETDKELILRDAEDREIRVPLDEIDETEEGGSLMPGGLVDTLTRDELVDLVRFLSELGKVGPFAVGQQPVVRRWQAMV